MITAPSALPNIGRGDSLALLFTDAKGRVVFVDQNFLALMGYGHSERLVGQSAHMILGLDLQTTAQLIDEVAKTGFVHERPLQIKDADGEVLLVVCNGVATYDDRNRFIGADITLRRVKEEPPSRLLTTHWDVLSERVERIRVEAEQQQAQREQMLLQLYFTAQISALQVLLDRMVGHRIREAMDSIVNNLTDKNHWPISILGSNIVIAGSPTVEAYRTLLNEVVVYAATVIGKRVVEREMSAVESQLGAECCALAGRHGLRTILAGR